MTTALGSAVEDLAREVAIETAGDAELVGEVSRRPELLAAVTGFATVDLDPRGFRSGSMNEALAARSQEEWARSG